jgi:hypothetical protein
MSITLSVQSDTDREQRLLMPGTYNWQQFEALEALLVDSPGLRITYLDGSIFEPIDRTAVYTQQNPIARASYSMR